MSINVGRGPDKDSSKEIDTVQQNMSRKETEMEVN